MKNGTSNTTSFLFLISVKLLIIMVILTGIIYPITVTLISKLIFPYQASGSIIMIEGSPKGSKLIAQNFIKEIYFWPRPSASDFATLPASASNLGPTSLALKQQVEKLQKKWTKDGQLNSIPAELIYTSGSGIDPHLSRAAVDFQFERVVKARKLSDTKKEKLKAAIDALTERSFFRTLNTDTINILELNLALDKIDSHEI